MTARTPYRISFVCTGNICRSPMGEVVLRRMLDDAGLGAVVVVDSAGVGPWHAGQGADQRTLTVLARHGYDGRDHRAQQITSTWVAGRDLVLAADRGHLDRLRAQAPEGTQARVRLLREFDPEAVAAGELEVDDPYHAEAEGFEQCLQEVERACRGVVEHVRQHTRSGTATV